LKTFALPNTNAVKNALPKYKLIEFINQFTGKKWAKLLLNVRMLISAVLQRPFGITLEHDATRAMLKPYVILRSNNQRGKYERMGFLQFGDPRMDDRPTRKRNFEIMAQIAWRQIVWTIVEDSDASPVVQRYQSLFV
jgi:hypothetical protein